MNNVCDVDWPPWLADAIDHEKTQRKVPTYMYMYMYTVRMPHKSIHIMGYINVHPSPGSSRWYSGDQVIDRQSVSNYRGCGVILGLCVCVLVVNFMLTQTCMAAVCCHCTIQRSLYGGGR